MTATVSPQPPLQARRNQQFEDRPASANAQCPLKALEVAIFPVRYAVDESPAKGSRQGPNPLPEGFSASHLPTLKTRSYTLRQVRDGWLYVWDEIEQTLHEYSIKGHLFTRLVWTGSDIGSDARNTRGDTRPYLLYPRHSKLQIAYSPIQWTWRICELMRSNPRQQARWMRGVDLAGYCATYTAAHGADLRKLADSVADISPSGQVLPFTTTLIPTAGEPADSNDIAMQIKPGISDALVLGAVPDQDTALFIALDDPMAVINDLNMHYAGRWAEIATFEDTHRNALQTALAVEQSCGVDLKAVLPSGFASQGKFAEILDFTRDAHTHLTKYAHANFSASTSPLAGAGAVAQDQLKFDKENFSRKWKVTPSGAAWHSLAAEWQNKSSWRNDVRFDEVLTFLHERASELRTLRTHVQKIEADVTSWLGRLGPEAQEIFYDTCDAGQVGQLLIWSEGLAQCLGSSGSAEADTAAQDGSIMQLARVDLQGQQWLYRQYAKQSGLIGLALFSFSKELAGALEQIAYNYSTTGTIDGLGQQPDNSGQGDSGIFSQNMARTANDAVSLLSLPAVQNSATYRALSDVARQSLDAMRTAAAAHARDAWNALSATLQPVLGSKLVTPRQLLTFSATQILVSTEIADVMGLKLNPDYKAELRKWQMQRQVLVKQQRGLQEVTRRSGHRQNKRAATVQLEQLASRLAEHDSLRPQHILAVIHGQIRTQSISVEQVTMLLATGGQSELQVHLRLKATNAAAYAARAKTWMNLNLGGALPVLLAGLGIWNLMATTKAIRNDGYVTGEELNSLITAITTSGSLLMALLVMPMWARAGGMAGMIQGDTFKLTQAGARVWLREGKLAHAKLAQRLIVRTAGMAVFNIIASVSEVTEISRQMKGATSDTQSQALWAQGVAVAMMGFLGLAQLGGSISGILFNFAWVMGPWMIGLLAIAGLVYLVASMVVSLFYREGLRLWLHRCYWGKAQQWDDSDHKHGESLWRLTQICLTPAASVRSTSNPFWHGLDGFWLQLTLPAQLAGQDCSIRAIPVARAPTSTMPRKEISLSPAASDTLLHGYWSSSQNSGPLSNMPPPGDKVPGDVTYVSSDPNFVWRTWIPVSGAHTVEIEITYASMLGGEANEPMRYMFRARVADAHRAAELISDPMSDAPIEGELLSRSPSRPVSLTLPLL